jgi:hypothetical protein
VTQRAGINFMGKKPPFQRALNRFFAPIAALTIQAIDATVVRSHFGSGD